MDEQEARATLEFTPSAARRSRILHLRETSHGEYSLWRTVMMYGGWISVAAGICGVPLFGLWWRREAWMLSVFCLSAALGLLVLAAGVFLAFTGRLSCWTLLDHERLTLGEEDLVYRVTRVKQHISRNVPEQEYVWTMPYADITRMDYERGTKCLRVFGRFREENCVRPPEKGLHLPKGMTLLASERKTDKDIYLDIPLYYDESVELLKELEERTGVFIQPAMRGDDYADLRDLPGLKPRQPVLRAFALFLALLGLGTLLITADLRRGGQQEWQPYPPTAAEMLTGSFSVGDSILLDGCRITLEKAEPGSNGGLSMSLLFENLNESMSVLLHLGKQQSNIAARAQTLLGEAACNYIPPDNPLVQLAPGGAYHYDVIYQIPANTQSVTLEINSDRWASNTHFWEPEYLGRTILIGGVEYLHNRVHFNITSITGGS